MGGRRGNALCAIARDPYVQASVELIGKQGSGSVLMGEKEAGWVESKQAETVYTVRKFCNGNDGKTVRGTKKSAPQLREINHK